MSAEALGIILYKMLSIANIYCLIAATAIRAQLYSYKKTNADFESISTPAVSNIKTLLECAAVMPHVTKLNPTQPLFKKFNAFNFNGSSCLAGKTTSIYASEGGSTEAYVIPGQLARGN